MPAAAGSYRRRVSTMWRRSMPATGSCRRRVSTLWRRSMPAAGSCRQHVSTLWRRSMPATGLCRRRVRLWRRSMPAAGSCRRRVSTLWRRSMPATGSCRLPLDLHLFCRCLISNVSHLTAGQAANYNHFSQVVQNGTNFDTFKRAWFVFAEVLLVVVGVARFQVFIPFFPFHCLVLPFPLLPTTTNTLLNLVLRLIFVWVFRPPKTATSLSDK